MAGELEDHINRRIRQAEDAIKIEIRRTRTEARAFKDFAWKVRDLDHSHPSNVAAGTKVQSVAVNTPRTQSRLRDAYETTVMAVPHYEEDYGDGLEESFAAEFGALLARALLKGANLDTRQKNLLLAKSRKARRTRLQFVEVLETERESVQTLSKRLQTLTSELETLHEETTAAETFGSYDAIRNRLIAIESRCDTFITRRQETFTGQQKNLSLPAKVHDVPFYVYGDLETTYPILASIADIISEIELLKTRVERGMAYSN